MQKKAQKREREREREREEKKKRERKSFFFINQIINSFLLCGDNYLVVAVV